MSDAVVHFDSKVTDLLTYFLHFFKENSFGVVFPTMQFQIHSSNSSPQFWTFKKEVFDSCFRQQTAQKMYRSRKRQRWNKATLFDCNHMMDNQQGWTQKGLFPSYMLFMTIMTSWISTRAVELYCKRCGVCENMWLSYFDDGFCTDSVEIGCLSWKKKTTDPL